MRIREIKKVRKHEQKQQASVFLRGLSSSRADGNPFIIVATPCRVRAEKDGFFHIPRAIEKENKCGNGEKAQPRKHKQSESANKIEESGSAVETADVAGIAEAESPEDHQGRSRIFE